MKNSKFTTTAEWRTEKKADVTVLISLYNYQDYILETLESVKSQSLSNIDLIIVDDCSSDNSLDTVVEWFKKNKKRFFNFLILSNTKNSGLAVTRNNGLNCVNTPYVFILDADNIIYPRCLEVLLCGIRNSGANFSYCYLEKFGSEKGILNISQWNPKSLRNGNIIDAMVLHSTKSLKKVKGYSIIPIQGWEDFELWFKLAEVGGWGIRVPEILARYRVHYDSMLHKETNPNVDKCWDYIKINHPNFFIN
jgi:glycosyltransferase involved in cell wall biosynthesis